MEPGTFASIPVKLRLIAGASVGYSNTLNFSAKKYYLLEGSFRINFLKVDEKRMRVKLTGIRKKGSGLSANVDYDFNLFGINLVDNAAGNLIGTKLFKIDKKDIIGENFSVDYIFDLSDNEARTAYDQFLNANLKFKTTPDIHPGISSDEIKDKFFSNLIMVDNIATEDIEKDVGKKRIQRLFKVSNFFNQTNTNIKLGIKLVSFKWGGNYIENELSVYDKYDNIKRYFMPLYNAYDKQKYLFGMYKENEEFNTFMLLDANKDWTVNNLDTLGIIWKKTDKTCFTYEFNRLKNKLIRMLGKENAEKLRIELMMPEVNNKVKNFKFIVKLLISPETVNSALNDLNKDYIWEALYNTFLDYGDEIANSPNDNLNTEDMFWTIGSNVSKANYKVAKLFKKNNWDWNAYKSLESFVDKIYELSVLDNKKKSKRFFKLIKKEFYREFIVRFLSEYAKLKNIKPTIKLSIKLRGNGIDSIDINSITNGNDNLISEKLFNNIISIISQITDTSFDLYDSVELNQ